MAGDRWMRETGDVRVAVVDDATFIRERFEQGMDGLCCVGTYRSVEGLLEHRPSVEVVVLDLQLSGARLRTGYLQGDRAVRSVHEAGYRICIYTEQTRRPVLLRCMRAGAQGLIHKEQTREDLVDAVRRVAKGEQVISDFLLDVAELLARRGSLPDLTDRQIAILHARARGEAWAAIARRLFITEGVAKEHLAIVTRKVSGYVTATSPADIERELGLSPGDLLG